MSRHLNPVPFVVLLVLIAGAAGTLVVPDWPWAGPLVVVGCLVWVRRCFTTRTPSLYPWRRGGRS